jgi:hypothetical protein
MKKLVIIFIFNFLVPTFYSFSQGVSINTTGAAADGSAMLDVSSSSKGLLIPRVALLSTTDVATIKSPANSLLVFNTNAAMKDGAIGYWYFDMSVWKPLTTGTSANNGWLTTGNSSTNVYNFIGTKDNVSMRFRTNDTARMIIDSLGNAGIGRAIPLTTLAATKTLDVAGTIMAEGGINKGPTNIPLFRWLPVMMTTYSGSGNTPLAIAFDGTNMWTANTYDNSVTKITPTGSMTTYSGTGGMPVAIAFDGTNMWTANDLGFSVTKIKPNGAMTTYSGKGIQPLGIAFDGTNMWTANYNGSVTKITPTGIMTTYSGTCYLPQGIAFDGTNMWTVNEGDNSVTKITPTGGMTTYFGTGPSPQGIAFDGTNMWTANSGNDSVTKITPIGKMTTYSGTGYFPQGIAFDGTNMRTSNQGDYSVTKITPNGKMTTYSGTGSAPYGIAFDGTNMWTTSKNDNSVTKILVNRGY